MAACSTSATPAEPVARRAGLDQASPGCGQVAASVLEDRGRRAGGRPKPSTGAVDGSRVRGPLGRLGQPASCPSVVGSPSAGSIGPAGVHCPAARSPGVTAGIRDSKIPVDWGDRDAATWAAGRETPAVAARSRARGSPPAGNSPPVGGVVLSGGWGAALRAARSSGATAGIRDSTAVTACGTGMAIGWTGVETAASGCGLAVVPRLSVHESAWAVGHIRRMLSARALVARSAPAALCTWWGSGEPHSGAILSESRMIGSTKRDVIRSVMGSKAASCSRDHEAAASPASRPCPARGFTARPPLAARDPAASGRLPGTRLPARV
jgi:hypothetical protein